MSATQCNQPCSETMSSSGIGKPLTTLWTIPNVLCAVRLIGSPGLIAFAYVERPGLFVAWYLFLALTDWLDGKIAVLWNQRSAIGPRLDTISDVVMYSCLLGGIMWLKFTFMWTEVVWIGTAVASYAISVAIALVKFHCWPSYHTRAAKISWLLVGVAVIFVLLDGSPWPFRMATVMVTLTNLETAAISLFVNRRLSDVASIYHAMKRNRVPPPE